MPDQDKSFAPPKKSSAKGKTRVVKDKRDDARTGKEERLDEGLEETFPASDPVAAHHIS